MLCVKKVNGDVISVLDTDDGVTQKVTRKQLLTLIKRYNLTVVGVNGTDISVAVGVDYKPDTGLEKQISDCLANNVVYDVKVYMSSTQWYVSGVFADFHDGKPMRASFLRVYSSGFSDYKLYFDLCNTTTKKVVRVDVETAAELQQMIDKYNPLGACVNLSRMSSSDPEYIVSVMDKESLRFISAVDKISTIVVDKSHKCFHALSKSECWYKIADKGGTIFRSCSDTASLDGALPLFYLACRLWKTSYIDGSLYIRVARADGYVEVDEDWDEDEYESAYAFPPKQLPDDDRMVAYRVDFSNSVVANRTITRAIVSGKTEQDNFIEEWFP